MRSKITAAVIAMASLLFAGTAFAYTPTDYLIPYSTDNGTTVVNADLAPNFGHGLVFGTDPTSGQIAPLVVQTTSGICDSGTTLYLCSVPAGRILMDDGVTPLDTQIAADEATSSVLTSDYASLLSMVTSMSGSVGFNPGAFFGNSASTTPFVASSTPGLMSSSMASKVNNAPSLIERTAVTTNGSGMYTWTFPTAFGVVPIVQATAQATTTGIVNAQIYSVSSTSVTIQTASLASVLGILTLTQNPSVNVELTAYSTN